MKKVFKTIVTAALAAIMAMPLFACSPGSGDSYEVDEDGNTVVKILFHVDKSTPEGQAYQKRINAFNAEYKSEHLKAVAVFKARTTGAGDYDSELTNAQMGGTLQDIITFDAPNCASYADAGLLYDISSELEPEEIEDFYSVNTYNGNIYGLPIQESSAGFFYNKTIFAQAGIDVSGYTVTNPWTFDQFKAVCKQLKDSGLVTKAVDMRLTDTKDEMGTYLLYPFIYAAGGDFTSSDGMTATGHMNSEKSMNGFKFLKSLVDEGYTSYDIADPNTFFTGKVGMYLSSGWTIPDIENKYKTQFPDRNSWGILPYPMGEKKASANGSWCYGVTDNGKKDKAPAIKLLRWMSSTESCKAIVTATGMIPSRKSVDMDYKEGSPEKTLLDQLSETSIARPATVSYPMFSTAFGAGIIANMNGKTDAELKTIVDNKTQELQNDINNHK